MEKNGFKVFDYPMTNRYGEIIEVGKIYKMEENVKYKRNGFHFCKNIEDTLRYVKAFIKKIDICTVIGRGTIDTYEDEYYGYFDMYTSSEIEIIKRLTHEEIINLADNLPPSRLIRFISGYKLSREEIEYFYNKYKNNNDIIYSLEFYQLNNEDIYFTRKRTLNL